MTSPVHEQDQNQLAGDTVLRRLGGGRVRITRRRTHVAKGGDALIDDGGLRNSRRRHDGLPFENADQEDAGNEPADIPGQLALDLGQDKEIRPAHEFLGVGHDAGDSGMARQLHERGWSVQIALAELDVVCIVVATEDAQGTFLKINKNKIKTCKQRSVDPACKCKAAYLVHVTVPHGNSHRINANVHGDNVHDLGAWVQIAQTHHRKAG